MLHKLLLTFFLTASALSAAEPQKLLDLRFGYEAAVTTATARLQKTYIQELERFMVEQIRAGMLRDALAVSDEIKRISPACKSILQYDLTADGAVIFGGYTISGRIGTLRYSLIPEHLRGRY